MLRFALALMLVLTLGGGPGLDAAEGKVIKVLPHFLDKKGRHALAPSLYERDAYQAYLRKNPDARSALRFDIQWKARTSASPRLRLRLEARGSKQPRPVILESDVKRSRFFSRWSPLKLEGDAYRDFGELLAWRATLWDGERLVDEQKSFLW